ncbi:MAG: hypothetical protein RLZZ450_603 [Pseudomonadota bacterium]|jgi:hypothetical protein
MFAGVLLFVLSCTGETEPTGQAAGEGTSTDPSRGGQKLPDAGKKTTRDAGTRPRADSGAAPARDDDDALQPDAPSGTTKASPSWCDVEPILKASCQECHAAKPLYGAPMPLVTVADLRAPAKTQANLTVLESIGKRIHDAQRPMPPATGKPLSPLQLATLDAFIAAGAPAGANVSCGDVGAPAETSVPLVPGRAITDDDAPWPEDCGEHYKFLAKAAGGGKIKIAPGREYYQNVDIPAPWGATKNLQALRFRAIVDNTKVLHHYILYAPDESFIDGWAPGQGGITMPPGVGMQLPNGTYRLELHYNNSTGTATEEDESGIEVCVAKTPRPNLAAVHELGSMSINVPPGGKQDLVSHCKPTVAKGPVHLMEVNPHMHKTGVHAKVVLKRANGKEEILHDRPFSFDEQSKYILPEDGSAADVLVNAGDEIITTCSFKNDQTRAIRFGTTTEDEMCFFYVIAWPMGQLVNGSRGPEGDPNACLGSAAGGFPGL